MAEFKHGSMDTSEHRKTFGGFLSGMVWGAVAVVIVLVFLAIVGT